jgi:group I intron endonuclease
MEQLKTSGVYLILNTLNSRIYIGSAIDVQKRWKEHRGTLRKGTHVNRHLQRAFSKYSEAAFEILMLEYTLPHKDALMMREQHYLDWLQPFGSDGYNICRKAGSVLGVKRSLKHREQIRQRMIGNIPWNKGKKRPPFSDEWRRKMGRPGESNPFYGKQHSVKTRTILSVKATERLSDPTKNPMYGTHLPSEKNGMFGKTHPPEVRERMAVNKGKKFSPEVREKMRLGQRDGHKSSTPVIQMDMQGNELTRYPSAPKAAIAVGTSLSNLRCCLLGRSSTAKGYKWRYAE